MTGAAVERSRPVTRATAVLVAMAFCTSAVADLRNLVDETALLQIAAEVSGEEAKRNLDTITLQHRMRASDQFEQASAHIESRLERYGLDELRRVEFRADGETMYGTQKSRPVWQVEFAELWELTGPDGERVRRLGNWDAVPLSLAQDSLSGEAVTTLVDIGAGLADADYDGKSVRGKLVLTSSQPGAVVERAVGELGAVGILSYAPNQRSAWWREDDRQVRWGHLSSFPETESFGFMISLGEARRLIARMEAGEEITLHAKVEAEHRRGRYSFVEAAIRGADQGLREHEILFTCHLDHPRPGANDNASGCVAILEAARALNALVDEGILPRPARTIRFLWPAEIEGSIMYLAEHEDPSRIKANIHMDMVGGGPETKAVFRVSGGPMSLPTFIADVGFEIARFMNRETEAFTSGEVTAFPLNAPEGGKEPLLALTEGLDMGSDHDVFREGTWRIPGLYLHDWPDRYIHTNFDTAAMIDPTKLKRSAFLGAVTAWYLADLGEADLPALLALLERNALERSGELLDFIGPMGARDAAVTAAIRFDVERAKVESIGAFVAVPDGARRDAMDFVDRLEALVGVPAAERGTTDDTVYARNPDVQGPMRAFGYSYLTDHYGADRVASLALPGYRGLSGSGGQYAYEALNLVDGRRTVSDIRDWLTAELGPVPLDYVQQYLAALAEIDVIRAANKQ